jgi:hypothetical protein
MFFKQRAAILTSMAICRKIAANDSPDLRKLKALEYIEMADKYVKVCNYASANAKVLLNPWIVYH